MAVVSTTQHHWQSRTLQKPSTTGQKFPYTCRVERLPSAPVRINLLSKLWDLRHILSMLSGSVEHAANQGRTTYIIRGGDGGRNGLAGGPGRGGQQLEFGLEHFVDREVKESKLFDPEGLQRKPGRGRDDWAHAADTTQENIGDGLSAEDLMLLAFSFVNQRGRC